MVEVTPELRERLGRLRERLASGEATPEEINRAREIVSRVAVPTGATAAPPDPPPTSVEEITGGFVSRPAMEAGLGTAGAILAGGTASPTGPGAIAAGLAGGGLGAAAGSALFDNTNDVLRFLNILATPEDATQGFERAAEIGGRAAQSAFEDAVFSAGGQIVGETLSLAGKPLLGRLLGLRTEEAQRIIQTAEEQGISIGATTAAQGMMGRAARSVSNVLGVFPFMTTVRGGVANQVFGPTGVSQRLQNLIDNFGPNATMRDQLGINMVAAVRGAREEFVRVSGGLYENARALSASAGHPKIIPADSIRELAQQTQSLREAGTLLDDAGQEISRAVDDKVGNFLESLVNLEQNISFAQFDNISNQMRDLVGVLSKEGFDISRIAQLRGAMETAIRSIDLRPSSQFEAFDPRPAIVAAMEQADQFYSRNIGQFQTPTAQRFGRVDRNIMRPGLMVPGTINADEAADIVLNLRSAEAVRDLRALAGDETMDAAARSFLEDVWQNSLKEGIPDADLFRQSLGLAGPQRSRVRESALREFLGEDTVSNLRGVADVLENIPTIPNANKFILRRTILGGARSFMSAATVVGGAGLFGNVSAGKALLGIYALRRLGDVLNNPDQLRAVTRVLGDQNATDRQARLLLGRLMAASGDALAIDITGPAGASDLTLEQAMNDPAVQFVIDFVRQDAGEDSLEGLAATP